MCWYKRSDNYNAKNNVYNAGDGDINGFNDFLVFVVHVSFIIMFLRMFS